MKVSKNLINSNLQLDNGRDYFRTLINLVDAQTRDPNYYTTGKYCAIGGDPASPDMSTNVWDLVLFDGTTWVSVVPDSDYSLIVTSEGLKAVTDATLGGYQLRFCKIQMFSDDVRSLAANSGQLLQSWTADSVNGYSLLEVFNLDIEDDESKWKNHVSYTASQTTGGLQICVKLFPTDLSTSGAPSYDVQTIFLYVNDYRASSEGQPVLFGIVALPQPIFKTVDVQGFGNELNIYINTVLDNLGQVMDLSMIRLDTCTLPMCNTEASLPRIDSATTNHYNTYLIQNLHGNNTPALAIKNSVGGTNYWQYITPNENSLVVSHSAFANDVEDYMFVAYDSTEHKYVKADGSDDAKAIIGVKVGNTIVFSGDVINVTTGYSYIYNLDLVSGGSGYNVGDALYVEDLGIDLYVTEIVEGSNGIIKSFTYTPVSGPEAKDPGAHSVYYASYIDPEAALGHGALVSCQSIAREAYDWSVDGDPLSDYINTPVYVSSGANAGKLTSHKTRSFVGWVVGPNTIRLGLDADVRATADHYGTVEFASDVDIQQGVEYKVLKPEQLRDNYIISNDDCYVRYNGAWVKNSDQARQEISSYLTFTKTINSSVQNGVAFRGTAYRALWGDLAEYYHADKQYPAGTLIIFGAGAAEITEASKECDGVISEKPGYILGEQKSELDLPVALVGKVPVLFDGQCNIHCGDKVYLSKLTPGRASTIPNGKCLGRVIDSDPTGKTKVMCVVKVNF